MVHLYRLTAAVFLLLVSAVASAFTANPEYTIDGPYVSPTTRFSSASAACGAVVSELQSRNPTVSFSVTSATPTICSIKAVAQSGYVDGYDYTVHEIGGTCPPFSTGTSPDCQCVPPTVLGGDGLCKVPACPVGQHEEGGACVPDACKPNETRVNGVCVPEPPCPAGQTRVNGKCVPSKCPSQGTVSDQWYEVTSTGTSATCLYNSQDNTYCTMSIKPSVIASSGGTTTYMGGYGVYTGGTCGPSEPGKPTPVDPDKPDGDPNNGTKPPGPNDPKPSDKPGGQPGGPGNNPTPPNPDGTCPPGTYKSNGGCYPKDPPTQPPDNDGKCPSGYIKVNDKCVPLMPTPDKEPGEEKDPSSFGGQCDAISCEGDAIQCAIARDQYRRSCQLMEKESAESQLYASNKGKEGNQTGSLPGNETISLQGRIDTSDALGGGSCFGDLNITVWNQAVTLPLSNVCQYLAMLGNILVAVSMLMAARIITRG